MVQNLTALCGFPVIKPELQNPKSTTSPLTSTASSRMRTSAAEFVTFHGCCSSGHLPCRLGGLRDFGSRALGFRV